MPLTNVFTINDNKGELFDLHKFDGTYIAAMPELYADLPRLFDDRFTGPPALRAAIGCVKPTDVLVLHLDGLDLPGPAGVVTPDRRLMPGGLPALWSFAELLRVASALELDVSPNELEIGLAPFPTAEGVVRRIFIADQLESGAGYATKLGEPETLRRVLEAIVDEVGPRLERDPHANECDASCPDCLRNYDNRRLHPLLDWRLGLDLAELAAKRPLREERWLSRGEATAAAFAEAFQTRALSLEGLPAVIDDSTKRLAFFGHPLWRLDDAYHSEAQILAMDAAHNGLGATEVKAFDLYTLTRWPQDVFAWLNRP